MRKTMIALAATTGLIGLGTFGRIGGTGCAWDTYRRRVSAVQQADWYCGPRCEYWRHRRWEQRHSYWLKHRSPTVLRLQHYNNGYGNDNGYGPYYR